MVCLLRNTVQTVLQKGDESTRRNKLMTCIQCITQSCRKQRTRSISHTAIIFINCTTHGPGSVAGIATGYGPDGPGIEFQ